MSGRFTFTSGNTLTAAQLNTNVMDGIPFKMVCGQVAVTGSLAVTFPGTSFSTGVVPTITANVASSTNTRTSVTFNTPTNTAVTFYVWAGTVAATAAGTVHYTAIQMTSTTGTGNS
jgi:hypothetical protein